jgi:gamma-glutamylcyclotransferase (GGCT)/AIG2-like uncharacterized protein YtfP
VQPPDGPFLLFVYGTLKRGGCRQGLLPAWRFHGPARSRPLYALLHLGSYPGLIACPDAGQSVLGEIYEIDADLRNLLDEVEGAPELYCLAPIEIEGTLGPVWAYFYQGDARSPRIETGSWDNGCGVRP